MKIGIIGTGSVGQTLAAKLSELGHSVVIGTRDVERKLQENQPDQYGNAPFSEWLQAHRDISITSFEEAARHGDVIINASKGAATLDALRQAGAENLKGKVLIDVGNPLDASKGFPPTLVPEMSNTTSLGEQVQSAFPETRVVKALNTMWAGLMVNPAMIGGGDHSAFLCGNDGQAKQTVIHLLKEMGWNEDNIIDLGDITSSRGTEAYLPFWLRIMNAKKTGAFNVKVIL